MGIKKEHFWRIPIAGSVCIMSVGCINKNTNKNLSGTALSAPLKDTKHEIVEENPYHRYPPYMRKNLDTPTPSPATTPETQQKTSNPVVIYKAPIVEEKKDIIVIDKNEKEKYFQPSFELDLGEQPPAEYAEFKPGLMYLTDQEWRNLKDWEGLIKPMAEWYKIDAKIVAAIIIEESGGVNGQTSYMGAVGLMGIMPGVRGAPDAEILMDPHTNMTWGLAKIYDVCKVQGDDIVTSLARYAGGEKISDEALRHAHKVLQKAGYMDLEGHLHIPEYCEPSDEVPEPPTRDDIPWPMKNGN